MSDIGQSATMALVSVVGAVNCASSMEESSESEWCRVQARTNSGGAGGGDSLKLTAASTGAGAVIIWRRAFSPSALKDLSTIHSSSSLQRSQTFLCHLVFFFFNHDPIAEGEDDKVHLYVLHHDQAMAWTAKKEALVTLLDQYRL